MISGAVLAENAFLWVAVRQSVSQCLAAVDVAAGRPQCKNTE